MDYSLLYEISRRGFYGHHKGPSGSLGKGPRRGYIRRELEEMGLDPRQDDFGNLWVESGYRGKQRVFSAHIDVDASTVKTRDIGLKPGKDARLGPVFEGGYADNSVGSYILAELARRDRSGFNNSYVFTASEEEHPKNGSWARSARKIAKEMSRKRWQRKHGTPSFCVAVDVTYPKAFYSDRQLEDMPVKEWDRKSAHDLFDQNDMTHCYLDGFKGKKSAGIATDMVSRFGSPDVKLRRYFGFDEAYVLSKVAPSMAVGPVMYGKPDLPGQKVRKAAVETALGFLKFVTKNEF